MFKKLLGLGALIMAFQITTEAHSVKGRVLDFEAEGIASHIWSGIHIPEKEIRESLRFLEDSDAIEPKYTQYTNFKSFYNNIADKLKDKKLINFADVCRKIYEESDPSTKFAIYLLLEKVTEKYTRDLKRFERAQKLKAQQGDQVPNEELDEKILKAFMNADKDITIK